MAQTDKAKQASQQQDSQDNQLKITPELQALIEQTVKPLQEQIATLKAEKEAAAQQAKEAAEARRLQQLADDKDIAKILAEAGDDKQTEDKLDNLSNKQLLDVISKAMDGAFNAQAEQLKTELSKMANPSNEKINNLEKVLMRIVGHSAAQEARQKHKDFDKFMPQINQVLQQIPGIDFEQAYYIAKGQEASKVPPGEATDFEKPTDFVTLPQVPGAIVGGQMPNAGMLQKVADRGNAARAGEHSFDTSKSGVVGFRNLLSQAISDVEAGKQ